MNMVATPAINVRRLILEALQKRPYRPAELLRHLLLQSADIGEGQLKDELAALLTEKVLDLSSDRYVIIRQQQMAAS